MDHEIERDLDAGRFLGLDGPRPGCSEIRVEGTVSSPNPDLEELRELCQHVQDTSPVRDSLAEPVPVWTTR